jgi:hypothetical protein
MSANLIELIPVFVIIILLVFLVPVLLLWLWNKTMTQIFTLKAISYWQSFRLLVISFLLIGIWMVIR